MPAIFEFQLLSETLSADELHDITGCARAADQSKWLESNKWQHHTNRAGAPVVGRMYARLRMAGITPSAMATGGWSPDFSGING